MNWHWSALIVCCATAFIWLKVGLGTSRDRKVLGLSSRMIHFAFAAIILLTGLTVFVRD